MLDKKIFTFGLSFAVIMIIIILATIPQSQYVKNDKYLPINYPITDSYITLYDVYSGNAFKMTDSGFDAIIITLTNYGEYDIYINGELYDSVEYKISKVINNGPLTIEIGESEYKGITTHINNIIEIKDMTRGISESHKLEWRES